MASPLVIESPSSSSRRGEGGGAGAKAPSVVKAENTSPGAPGAAPHLVKRASTALDSDSVAEARWRPCAKSAYVETAGVVNSVASCCDGEKPAPARRTTSLLPFEQSSRIVASTYVKLTTFSVAVRPAKSPVTVPGGTSKSARPVHLT